MLPEGINFSFRSASSFCFQNVTNVWDLSVSASSIGIADTLRLLKFMSFMIVVVVHVSVIRPCLWIVATQCLWFVLQVIYEYGATVEWYWQRKAEELGGKKLFHCHFVYHISHMNWFRLEPGPPRWEAGANLLSHRRFSSKISCWKQKQERSNCVK
jgi:hypothetical protein